MNPEPSWPRIWELFEQALDRPVEERKPWLQEACAGDTALLEQVQRLVRAHETDGGLLDQSVQPLAAEALCEAQEIRTGQQIGPYLIIAEVGRGGMGVVYKAEDTRLERTVALKFLAPHLVADPEIRERFSREAKAAATLNHPNICTVYEIEEIEGKTFISMAFIDGQGLEDKIKQGPLKLPEALDIASQIGEGLAEAHSQGIVHRDVKPGNIMIRAKERGVVQPIIMDFGLARLVRRSTLTRVGTRVGTVSYMSPEQTEGSKVNNRSDIWALGVVLYEMISGLPPFRGEYDEAVLYSVLNEEPEALTAVRAGLPMEIDWIVSKALSKSPEERYQTVEELVTDLRRLSHKVESGRHKPLQARSLLSPVPGAPAQTSPRRRLSVRTRWAVALLLTALASAALSWWIARRTAPGVGADRDFQLTRITRDAGLSTEPALSPDGSMIAYASDRTGNGDLDIWLQQTSQSGAVRLTTSDADDHQPSFSPDGSRIVFRSERDGGGIYIVPVLGGDVRLIAKNGRRPSFSPDGSLIAFYAGAPGSFIGSKLFVVSSFGGVPKPLQADFDAAAMPVWTPDGKHLLFWGRRSTEDFDLWVTPLEAGLAVNTATAAALERQRIRLISLDTWEPGGNEVLFSGIREHSVNLWRLPFSLSQAKMAGPAERLTFGADERSASAATGWRYAFTSNSRKINVWGLPLEGPGGAASGTPQQITAGAAIDTGADISSDGKTLAFRSSRWGDIDIWVQHLPEGTLRQLTAGPENESVPRISADGSKVAYGLSRQGKRPIYVVPAAGGLPREVCPDCGVPQAWSPDGAYLLYLRTEPAPTSIYLLDPASGESRPILAHREIPVYACHLSPDGRWLAFKGDVDSHRTRIFVAPFQADEPIAEQDWIPLTEGASWDDLPRWSADGQVLYYLSDRDGFRCVWARRFNRTARQPEGEVFPVHHFHQVSLSLSNLSLTEFELAVARDKLVFPLATTTGNVWMINPTPPAEAPPSPAR